MLDGRLRWCGRQGRTEQPLGHPWIPDSVKVLGRSFVTKDRPFGMDRAGSIKSARLYATALGAYEMFLNGKRVGDQVLAPGWTDYRERVTYQTYDVTALRGPRMECDLGAVGARLV